MLEGLKPKGVPEVAALEAFNGRKQWVCSRCAKGSVVSITAGVAPPLTLLISACSSNILST